MTFVIKSNGHDVVISRGQLDGLQVTLDHLGSDDGIFILADENTRRCCLPRLIASCPVLENVKIIEVPAGENSKSMHGLEYVLSSLAEAGAVRNSLLLNLGGGVVGDLGGFAASIYMRGMRCVQIPTTLLAMVDASVGGKTAIDFKGVKNLIGTFSQPELVWIDVDFLQSLPEKQLRSGFAEVIKHSVLANVPPFDALPLPAELSALDWLPLVVSSVTYKNEIIQLDYKDNHLRKVLNFGHTIGHVLESHSLKNGSEYLLHGEAVALGMMIELVLSVKYASFPEEKMFKYMRFLRMHFNDLKFPSFDDGMIPLLSLDKKNSNGVIKCVLLGEEGNPLIDQVVEVEEVMQAMRLLNESGTLFS